MEPPSAGFPLNITETSDVAIMRSVLQLHQYMQPSSSDFIHTTDPRQGKSSGCLRFDNHHDPKLTPDRDYLFVLCFRSRTHVIRAITVFALAMASFSPSLVISGAGLPVRSTETTPPIALYART